MWNTGGLSPRSKGPTGGGGMHRGLEHQDLTPPPHPPASGPFRTSPGLSQVAANLVGPERSGAPHPHACLVVGEGMGLCSPCKTPTCPGLSGPSHVPSGRESWLLLIIAGWAMRGASGSAYLP